MLWAKRNKSEKTKFNYWDMKHINGGTQMKNLWEYSAKRNIFRHPATKQSRILENCVLAASDQENVILDPFAGSGTTGFVARGLKRKAVLIEIEKKFCFLSRERLEGKYGCFERQTGN
jgi:site-specific DNA-methyltransferase (adenine-specific)